MTEVHKRSLIRKAGRICAIMNSVGYFHSVHLPYYIVDIDGPTSMCEAHFEEIGERDQVEVLLKVMVDGGV